MVLPITFFAYYKPRLVFTSMSGFSEYMLLLMYAVSSDLVSLLIWNVSFVYNAYFAFIMILLNEIILFQVSDAVFHSQLRIAL